MVHDLVNVVKTHIISALHIGVDQDLALFLSDVGGSHGAAWLMCKI